MSKSKKHENPVIETEQETAEVTEVVTESESQTMTEVPVEEKQELATGKVVGCFGLNVREHPDRAADALYVLPGNTEVKVDINAKYGDWYRVFTASGIEGFCMKKYITINS